MNNSEELKLLIMFSLLAAINLMVLSFVLLFKKNNILANKVLGGLVFIPSVVLMANAFLYMQYFSVSVLFVFLGSSICFLFGPLLLLYIHLVQENTYDFKIKDLLHFFPVVTITFYGVYIGLQSSESIHENYLNIVAGEDMVTNIIYLAQLIHFAIYITWSIRKVNLIKMKTYLSIVDKTNYKWLKFFVTRLLYLNILILLVYVVQISFFPSYVIYSDLLATPLASSCFYPIMVYKSFSNKVTYNTGFFDKKEIKSKEVQLSEPTFIVQEEHNEELNSDKILSFLQKNKTYLNKDYTIHQLGADLNESPRTVSKVINSELNKSFIQLINEFRVEEAIVLLKLEKDKLTIDAIAEKAGFKSRSSFYRVFKNIKQTSPSQYFQ
ncbi:helix-turn-helix domain-containing protein [Wenyingzhuangia sp. chi5]|uniref:Helix-turn-helix domain-containing protein n=1 Tax=Wenyingzhuangia gilva TaxID=3057677 RepID=A0ABT8VP54_9FLAO|nr:helix-turn-helix domain-containing protein [Wenyingzhuangia sp. chi5]MDO3693761.1 helix-turn-helix domain-containing protein [Wenyingzhuangia sp. chi5]